MPDEPTPIRQQIEEIRGSKAYLDNLHPSHEAAMKTIADLYSREFPEPDADPPKPEEVEGTLKDAQEVQADALKVDDPEQAKIQEALAPLKSEWGTNYEANIEAAQGLVAQMTREMGLEAVELFDDIGNHPTVIKACFEWSQGRDGGELSAEQAKEVIALIQKSGVYQRGISQTSEVLRNVMAAPALAKITFTSMGNSAGS
jgi:hypothetical protein